MSAAGHETQGSAIGSRLAPWRRSVGARFGVPFALTLVATQVGIIVTLSVATDRVRTAVARYAGIDQPSYETAQRMETDLVEASLALSGYLSDGDPARLGAVDADLAEYDRDRDAVERLAAPAWIELLLVRLDLTAVQLRSDVDATVANRRRFAAVQDAFSLELTRIDRLLDERLLPAIGAADSQGFAKLRAAMDLEIKANDLARGLAYLNSPGATDTARLAQDTRDFRTYHATLSALVKDPRERALVAAIGVVFERAASSAANLVAVESERAALQQAIHDGSATLGAIFDEQLHPAVAQAMATTRQDIDGALDGGFIAVGIVVLVAALAGLAWIGLLNVLVTRPISRLAAATDALASGDLDSRVEVNATGDIGDLVASFNRMATARKAAEDEVVRLNGALQAQVEALEDSNRELESFTYSVSHDLRAPLRAIDGFAQIVEDRHAAGMDPEGRAHLSTVRQSARRMGFLIDDLLRLSRMGREAVRISRVEPAAVVRAVVDESGIATDPNVEMVFGPLPACDADPVLLKQVYANLLQNAHKFSRGSRPARIEVGATSDTGQNGAPETVYFVRDNGTGFDERYARNLFGVFQRLHRPDDFEGTGVGLAIVHRIVDRHGGRIWARGQIGSGATFSFTLPGLRP